MAIDDAASRMAMEVEVAYVMGSMVEVVKVAEISMKEATLVEVY